MPRKKLKPHMKKQQLIVLLTPLDKERVADRAYEEELTVSEYVRQLIKRELDDLDELEIAE